MRSFICDVCGQFEAIELFGGVNSLREGAKRPRAGASNKAVWLTQLWQ